jgi:hypothetical protein
MLRRCVGPTRHGSGMIGCNSLILAFCLAGCGGQGVLENPSTAMPATIAPSITTQPAGLTVPIGLEGIFYVGSGGNGNPTFQWYRNGVAIPDTNSLSYTTSPVTAANSGDVYTFTVTNSLGSATSRPAILTAGARAPQQGDLRFQQVDSENTINGVGGGSGLPEDFIDRGGYLAPYSIGILDFDYEECPPNGPGPIGCVYFIVSFGQPYGTTPLATCFFGGFYSDLQADLSNGVFSSVTSPFGGGSLLSPNTVVTSLVISSADDRFALSYTKTSQAGGFDLAQHNVDPSQLQAAATQEGQHGRVITALSYNGTQITYFSYGWTGDTTTLYETQTATSTFATAGVAAANLAAQGYIITALGGDDIAGVVVMVGTRVQGDTLPRQIAVIPYAGNYAPILTGGYAVVGELQDAFDTPYTMTTIGER